MKNKIKWILKRVTYIDEMIKEGAKKRKYYINKRYEIIEIGEIELKVIEIINDVVRSEKEIWIKKIFREKKKGEKDIKLIIESPVSGKKYYEIKRKIVDKIYHCCIAKGLVTYEETLKERIE